MLQQSYRCWVHVKATLTPAGRDLRLPLYLLLLPRTLDSSLCNTCQREALKAVRCWNKKAADALAFLLHACSLPLILPPLLHSNLGKDSVDLVSQMMLMVDRHHRSDARWSSLRRPGSSGAKDLYRGELNTGKLDVIDGEDDAANVRQCRPAATQSLTGCMRDVDVDDDDAFPPLDALGPFHPP